MRAEMVLAMKVLGYEAKAQADAYRAFQKKNGLPATGRPTRETVRAIKEKYNEKVSRDAQASAESERVKQGTVWALVGAAALALNFWMLLALRAKVRLRKRQVANLTTILSDLDTKSLP
jgi:peptidoglycan hydrolase-like protein with peptidoglycan-binding domain